MKDGIPKGNGTSRRLKAKLPATYEEFRQKADNGQIFMDILFNAAGWSQIPDFLNKKNLLSDDVLRIYSLAASAVPNDVFAWLKPYIDRSLPHRRLLCSQTVQLPSAGNRPVTVSLAASMENYDILICRIYAQMKDPGRSRCTVRVAAGDTTLAYLDRWTSNDGPAGSGVWGIWYQLPSGSWASAGQPLNVAADPLLSGNQLTGSSVSVYGSASDVTGGQATVEILGYQVHGLTD